MKFARIVFVGAGVWGVAVLTPFFWLVDVTGRRYQPPVGTNPARFRPLMIPSIVEKFGYVALLALLYSQSRISLADAQAAFPDLLLGTLFAVSFVKTRPARQER